MSKIIFTKMSGAGNDFVIISKDINKQLVLSQSVINKICNRRFGIGADGVITIASSSEYDFGMEYFNADGSTGTLCANGARCALKYVSENLLKNKGDFLFLSDGVQYSGEVFKNGRVKFNLNNPKNIKLNFKVKASNQLITACYADTGSPHVVVKIKDMLVDSKKPGFFYSDIRTFPVFNFGKEIRNLPEFYPSGTNVNFINIVDDKIFIRTFERGVEDETFACGTGSVASSLIASLTDGLKPPIKLITYGGDELIVNFEIIERKFKNISITGPAEIIFEGEFAAEKYQ
ncbi:MAG: diaminopimelate epimerase [Ignavibacteriales bacterium]|nr:diaminopimelate epimerase [Ignavibacteriales bacterium]